MGDARACAVVLVSIVVGAAACSSGSGASVDAWSRDYLATYDNVFACALDSLEAMDFYLVEEDVELGEIRADASVRRSDNMTLLVRVDEHPRGARVDVMVRSPNGEIGSTSQRMSAVVSEFLGGLSARLEGRSD